MGFSGLQGVMTNAYRLTFEARTLPVRSRENPRSPQENSRALRLSSPGETVTAVSYRVKPT